MWILLALLAWLVPITCASTVTVDFSKVIRTSRTVTTLQARVGTSKLGVADHIGQSARSIHFLSHSFTLYY